MLPSVSFVGHLQRDRHSHMSDEETEQHQAHCHIGLSQCAGKFSLTPTSFGEGVVRRLMSDDPWLEIGSAEGLRYADPVAQAETPPPRHP